MSFIFRNRNLFFWGLCLLTVILGFGASRLRVDFSFESFYPKDDPEYQYYDAFRKLFDEDQNFVVQIALQSPSGSVFDRKFLQSADSLFRISSYLPGIDSSISATTISQIRRRGLKFESQTWLNYESEASLQQSIKKIEDDRVLEGVFISRDKKYLFTYLFTNPRTFDSSERDVLISALEHIFDGSGKTYLITGIPYIRTQYVRKLVTELAFFLCASFFLIALVLFLMYRNFWGVFVPVVIVLLSLIWIGGVMGFSGQGITLINNLIIPIMFIVGMSDVIHLITKYLVEVRKGLPREEAMLTTMKEIGFATFITSVTSAIGFASLMTSRVPPIREFGLHASIAVMFAYVITIVIIPYLMVKIDPRHFAQMRSIDNLKFWKPFTLRIYLFVFKYPRYIIATFSVLILISLALITRISLDMYLLEDISKRDPIYKTLRFFEEQAIGIRPFEMAIEAKPPFKVTELQVLNQMDTIQDFLSLQTNFSPFVSITSFLKEANYVYHNNKASFRRLPESQSTVDETLNLAESMGGEKLIRRMIDKDHEIARVSARIPDIGTDAFNVMHKNLDAFIAANCDTSMFSYRITGHAFLTEHNLTYLRTNLIQGLFLESITISIIMLLLFRSPRMLLVSIIPNLIPLLITGGVMGLFGIHLTASTAIVFVISFGIAVDDTIHVLTHYHLERKMGRSVPEAIKNTIMGTGKAIIVTSLILLAGYVLLLGSSFGGTFSIGLFSAITIVFAVLSDLFLTPLLILWLERGTKTLKTADFARV